MTNYDKHKDEIIKLAGEFFNHPYPFNDALMKICNKPYCEAIEWIFSKYEPPLLENGDGLKPGDWIMVRDEFDDRWKKRAFMAYYDGRFIVVRGGYKIGEHNEVEYTRQARLPEEGE